MLKRVFEFFLSSAQSSQHLLLINALHYEAQQKKNEQSISTEQSDPVGKQSKKYC